MNLKFKNEEKIEIIFILISSISLILGYLLSINYLSWISIILCGIPIFKECVEGLITELILKQIYLFQ